MFNVPKYELRQTKDFKPSRVKKYLAHSAKGTQWDEDKRKYIKVEDGKYYYPDSYEGGRHLPKGEQPDSASKSEPSGWESKFYNEFESNLNRIGGKLDPKQIQELLLFGKNSDGSKWDNFAVALAEHAGIDADKIDPNVLNAMRYKVVEHYKKEFEKEKENFDKEGNRIKNSKPKSTKSTKATSGSSKSAGTATKEATKSSVSKDEKRKPIHEGRGMHADYERRNASSDAWSAANERKKKKANYNKALASFRKNHS